MSVEWQPGVLFRIDGENSRKITNWLEEIHWQILKSRLEKTGKVWVRDRRPDEGSMHPMIHLTEMPQERDRYRPHYGTFGGGFEYFFRPRTDLVELKANALIKDGNGQEFAPLTLSLPNPMEWKLTPKFMHGLVFPGDSDFEPGENQFGFHGEFFDQFRRWVWYSEDPERYEFQFYPMSVGCQIRAVHLKGNVLLDLTRDVEW